MLERTDITVDDLRREGLTSTELAAVQFLTRPADESFELHVLTIEHARGPAGRLARCVKLADLDDHLARGPMAVGAPPYAWGRRHIALGRERYDDAEDRLPPDIFVAAAATEAASVQTAARRPTPHAPAAVKS